MLTSATAQTNRATRDLAHGWFGSPVTGWSCIGIAMEYHDPDLYDFDHDVKRPVGLFDIKLISVNSTGISCNGMLVAMNVDRATDIP